MPIYLQEKLLQWILHPLSCVTERIPCIVRETAFSLSVMGIILLSFARGSDFYTGRYLFQYLISWCFLGIMILAGLTPDLNPIRFSAPLMACWIGISSFMLLTGILIETNALANAITWLVMLPIFYLVWNNADFDRFVSLVFRGVLLSFLFFSVVSIFFYPIRSINYASFFSNRNGTGQYLAAVFTCLLIYFFSKGKWSFGTIAAVLALGFTAATIYYTSCRTAIVASAFCFLCVSLFQLWNHRENWQRVFLCQLLPVIAVTIIFQPTAIRLYQSGYRLAASVQTALVQPETPDTPDVPEKPVEPSTSEVLDEIKDYTSTRFEVVENGLDDSTAERVILWKIHLREVGFLGNSSEKVLYHPNGNVENRTAHFTMIQFAYDYGFLSGVLFLFLNISAGLASIRFAVKRRDLRYCLFPFAAAITFGAESVMEAIGNPMIESLSLLYFLSLTPLLILPQTGVRAGQQASV